MNGSVSVATIIVDGARIFNDSVLLAEYTNIQGNGGVITFDSTLDSETSTDEALAITFASNVDISFNGKVGSINRLERLQIINSGSSTSFINTSQILTNRQQRWGTDIVIDSPTNQLLMNVGINGSVKIGSSGANHTVRSLVANNESLTIESSSVVSIFSTIGDNNQELDEFTIESSSTMLLYNDISTVGNQAYIGSMALANDAVLTANILDFRETVDNGGFDLTLNPLVIIFNLNVFSGSGDVIKEGVGSFAVQSSSTVTGDIFINQGSITNSTGTENAFANASGFYLGGGTSSSLGHSTTDIFTLGNGQTLAGTGICDCNLSAQSGSIVSPGFSTGQLTSNELNMKTGSTLNIELNGGIASYDQYIANSVNLDANSSGGATLNITIGNFYQPALGDTLTIIDSNSAITTTFNGLTQGASFWVGDYPFSIDYTGGDGNDVVLTSLGSSILHVDADAAGGNGQNWASAFNNLQDALVVAISGMEIWVAEGVYYPDVGGSQMDNDRLATFTLIDGVSIYGGFDGTETDLNQRSPEVNITVLSGDIDGDDTNDDGNNIAETTDDIINNNSYNILIGSNVDTNTILDGFTITAGNATSADTVNKRGAGIYCGNNTTGPSLNQMTFIANYANDRGAATFGCSQNVTNSSYINHYSGDLAGAVLAKGGYYENITFEGNEANRTAGAIRNISNFIQMKNVKFIANKSRNADGGGMYSTADIALENVLFSGNKAGTNSGDEGGGLYLLGNIVADLTNVTFTGNRAGDLGGAISTTDTTTLNIQNSIIWNNLDSTGANTITASINIPIGAVFTNSNSLIQAFGTTGIGNLDEDPLFITDTDPTTAPTTAGNARLMYVSNAIDAGDDMAVTTLLDLDGNDRIQDTAVDMGAYEYTDLIFANGFE